MGGKYLLASLGTTLRSQVCACLPVSGSWVMTINRSTCRDHPGLFLEPLSRALVQSEVEAQVLPGPSIKRWRRVRYSTQLRNDSAAPSSWRDGEDHLWFAVCCCGRGQPPPTCSCLKTVAAPAATAAFPAHIGDLALALLVTQTA